MFHLLIYHEVWFGLSIIRAKLMITFFCLFCTKNNYYPDLTNLYKDEIKENAVYNTGTQLAQHLLMMYHCCCNEFYFLVGVFGQNKKEKKNQCQPLLPRLPFRDLGG